MWNKESYVSLFSMQYLSTLPNSVATVHLMQLQQYTSLRVQKLCLQWIYYDVLKCCSNNFVLNPEIYLKENIDWTTQLIKEIALAMMHVFHVIKTYLRTINTRTRIWRT